MTEPLKILIIEQKTADAIYLKNELNTVSEFEFATEHVDALELAAPLIASHVYDAILISSHAGNLPLAKIRGLRESAPSTAIVVISPFDDRALVASAVEAGADNCLVKEGLDGNRLALGIMYAKHRRSSVGNQDLPQRNFLKTLEKKLLARISNEHLSLNETMEEMMVAVESRESCDYRASVLLLRADGKLYLGAAPSLPQGYNDMVEGLQPAINEGSCGTAAFCRHPIYVVDIETDPLWIKYRDATRIYGMRACWSMPIISSDDKVLGTFALYYDQRRTPNAIEREFIHAAAQTAANLIECAVKAHA